MESRLCSRCKFAIERDQPLRFCPRCGAEYDGGEPVRIVIDSIPVEIGGRFAAGDACNLYHCRESDRLGTSVFKIVRTAAVNAHLAHESKVLQKLFEADRERSFTPFFPQSSSCIQYNDGEGALPRYGAIRRYADEIRSPDELYTLDEVCSAYPAGIDARDMAWMWRRLLSVLGFVHQAGLVHAAINPGHILIEPRDHKLLIIGWSRTVRIGQQPRIPASDGRDWSMGARPAFDLDGGAACMRRLLKPDSDYAILRHLGRASESGDAWRLLEDFDRLIDAMWGPRSFRPFTMPPRGG